MTTAVVKVKNKKNEFVVARALLDSCSTVNLITESFAKNLNLPLQTCSVNIGAVDNLCTISKNFVNISFHSNYNNFKHELAFLVVPKIADAVPNDIFPRELFNIPKNIQLADPQFHLPKSIDILLASNTTLSTLAVGQIKLRHNESVITLQKTHLGWIVAGGSEILDSSKQSSVNVVTLNKLIEKFWLVEDFDHEPVKSRDEIACEQHFITHTTRDASGRYTTRLPFRDNIFELGESKKQAFKRYQNLESKFKSNPSFKTEYTKVIDEYISLGHMTLCNDEEGGYYLPHHAVRKESSETTKVRVVFDASAKTSTGISLNDALMVGPTIQSSIFELMLRFRTKQFIITAVIAKMYRQVLIHPDDRKFQKILWPYQVKLRTWHLNTVTFGVACAPFLAIRTLHQLARDEAHNFPVASKLLLRDFYVDDFISGADSFDELLVIRDEMIALLARGGFSIRQWSSNHPSILDNFDINIVDLDCLVKENPINKTLGILYNSKEDHLQFTLNDIDPKVVVTKRKLLSQLAKIFDPLGLLGPVVLYAKVLMQDCWKSKVSWDESLPQHIHTKWKLLADQLQIVQKVSFPRKILISNPVNIELHGFCDACDDGYGACIYIRSVDSLNNIVVNLACSKSRVAPLSKLTTPRLELCAASLLKKLLVESKAQFQFSIDKITLWSDSTIVLCWIKKAPHLLRTFESNRVADIQTISDQVEWKHVRSADNPADALSRGQLPSEFSNNPIWRSGPKWLVLAKSKWPISVEPTRPDLPGLKKGIVLLNIPRGSVEWLYLRYSSYSRFIKIFSYILRWRNLKTLREFQGRSINIREYEAAESRVISVIQKQAFPREYHELLPIPKRDLNKSKKEPRGPNKIRTRLDMFNPFVDEHGLLRVGGRLKRANLFYGQKHPLLLPPDHHITEMIIHDFHHQNKHAGVQSTLHAIRSRFWILNGKQRVRNIIRKCIECIRIQPPIAHAQMADLPEQRVNESPAFCHTGVDFFGPMTIKQKKFRNTVLIKTYGCVFVCMASKAVHIELASDISSEEFLAVLRRFVSRRGVPEHIYSDNGTNFVGANRELREICKSFETPEFKSTIENFALSKKLEWHFNPPVSPHFGGLWEAAVKSFKHHLKRVLKDVKLTYEQMNTLPTEIEAILNSRPLYSLSADPNDPSAITPAHLLIGRPFNFLPERNLVSVPSNRLSTINFITKTRQDFWSKWRKEYLHGLQTRQKWHESTIELKCGDVVLMLEDNVPCGRWPLGVIIKVFPGSNSKLRVAEVKTAKGVYTRNITRLCVLPVIES